MPLTPANFFATTLRNSVAILWHRPATGPAPTGFVVNVSGSFVGSLPTTSRTISAVAGSGTYTFSVFAFNACGNGSATAAQTISIPEVQNARRFRNGSRPSSRDAKNWTHSSGLRVDAGSLTDNLAGRPRAALHHNVGQATAFTSEESGYRFEGRSRGRAHVWKARSGISLLGTPSGMGRTYRSVGGPLPRVAA